MSSIEHFLRSALLCALPAAAAFASAAPGDQLVFHAEPGTKVHKHVKISHELRIDDTGDIIGDLPFVSSKTGGWVSSTVSIQFVDDYKKTAANRPLEFVRTIREAMAQGKANVTRQGGAPFETHSASFSPLRKQNVHFQWIEDEKDWSRSYEKIEAEEAWLGPLRGEFELIELLPKGPVEAGDTWTIDVAATRSVFAAGGNLQLVPSGDNLFGRLMELGVGADFADYYEPVGGAVEAQYKGRREVAASEGAPAQSLGVIELTINIVSQADRADLYRMAMPESERKEFARVDAVPVEYTLTGKGELLWDFEHKRAHSLTIEGQEGYFATISKTRFDGRQQTAHSQLSRYSGPSVFSITFNDASKLAAEPEMDKPKLQRRKGK